MQFNKSMSVNCYYVNPQRKLFLKRVISKKKGAILSELLTTISTEDLNGGTPTIRGLS
jgi:hypothetical protein